MSIANASSSESARLSITPLPNTWVRSSPRSSFVMSMPSAALTTGGPPGNTWLVPLTITLKWARQASTAGSPATEPSTAATTGTLQSRSSMPGVAGFVGM